MDEAQEIAAKLTEAQRRALVGLTAGWQAGPSLPDEVIAEIKPGEADGLIEREFADHEKPTYRSGDGCLSVSLSACWFFRLTPLGLEVRKVLERQS